MDVITSVQGIPIRVTDERWLHVVEEHSELSGMYYNVLEVVQTPDEVYEGHYSEFLAVKRLDQRLFLIAIYKVVAPDDGFLITAFLTTRKNWFMKRKRIWPREK